ncbi:hypothetical protein CROQUDRAFT_652386 [Cronartium quercuum f. sp. fusiforme G11]|uniref:Uncharacterized protein n=1 Tax=Cronartium quercuum f. sp. fusiforme G11 TaxID=708437 RepID=A0A9P6NVZ6_9BASI|nr:hypothetical protein CROQUDRAFT_652386 [Cronartium quercuum f. sp. fusiforme G11]
MSKQLHALIDPHLLDMAATTLSPALSTLFAPACVLELIIPAAQTRLNTTTNSDGRINSTVMLLLSICCTKNKS